MRTVSDLVHDARGDKEPRVWCLKVVPDAEPNSPGVWREFMVEHRHREPRKYMDSLHKTQWDALSELVASKYPNHHCVAIQTDGRFANKPGDWQPNRK